MIKYYRSCLEQSNGIEIDSLTITSPPTKTIYKKGDTIDTTGLEVIATSGKMTGDVTSHCAITPQVLDTEGTQDVYIYYGGKTTSFQVTAVPSSLEDTSWSTIQSIGASGQGSQYWAIGDTKSVHLQGAVGSYLSLNETYKVFIIHFNYRNQNGIYFQGFKTTDEVDIALCDTMYTKSSRSVKACGMFHYWASGNTYTYGGWTGTDLRYDILGSTDIAPSGYGSNLTNTRVGYDATDTCATNPVANTLMATLPSELRNVLAPWTVYTYNNPLGGGSGYNKSEYVTPTVDYLPLLSEYEVKGTYDSSGIHANQYEHNYQERISYYRNGNTAIKYKQDDINTASRWFLRSLRQNTTGAWLSIDTTGEITSVLAGYSYAISPAFRVA